MTTYSISATSQFMQNQMAAQPLAPQSALAVAMTASHYAVLFSIDDTNALRATIGQEGLPTGWTSSIISGGIPVTNVNVKAFGAAQATDPTSGAPSTITLLVAVTIASPGTHDEIFMTSLEADPNAPWTANPSSIVWTPRPFDFTDTQLPDLVAGTLNVANVMMATLSGGAPFGAVTVADPDSGIDRPFTIDLNPADTTSLWQYMIPEQDYTDLLDSELGQPAHTIAPGIYKLYSYTAGQNAELALTFKPLGQFPARYFAITPNATAFATAPIAVSGDLQYTSLLVADGGSIVVYPYDSTATDANHNYTGTIAVTNASTTTILSNVSALHAAVNGSLLSVWGVNGSGQIFYVQASVDSSGHFSNWSVPLPLLSNVERAAPYLSESRQLSAIYAVVSDPATEVQSLYELQKDPVAGGGWTQQPIHLPATNAYANLRTYTTRVQVTDASTNLAAFANVQVTASSAVVLQINGSYTTLHPDVPVTIPTDGAGCLTLQQVVGGLGAPTYSFAIVDPQSNVAQSPSTVDPTASVRATLGTYTTGPQLLAAQTTTADFQQAPLLTNVSSDTAQQLADGIQAATSVTTGAPAPPSTTVTNIDLGGILTDLGDLVQAVAQAFDNAIATIEQDAAGVVRLVVHLKDVVLNAIVQTAEDVANAIVALFNAVETIFEDIFRWLAFLFNWQNILIFQTQLIALYNAMLSAAGSITASALRTASAWVEYLGQQIQNDAAALIAALPDQTLTSLTAQAQAAQTQSGTSPVAQTDPRLYWGQSHIQSSASTTTMPGGGTPAPGDAEPLPVAFANLAVAINAVLPAWLTDIEALIVGNSSLRACIGEMLTNIGTVITDLGAVVDAAAPLASTQIDALQTAINAPIEIPLFTALYADITCQPLTILSLFTLIEAVPVAVVYDLATNGNGQAADFLPPARLSEITATLNALPSHFPQPPASGTLMRRAGVPTPRLASSGVDGLLIVTGMLHILRGFTTVLVEVAVPTNDEPRIVDMLRIDGWAWCFEGVADCATVTDFNKEEGFVAFANVALGALLGITAQKVTDLLSSQGCLAIAAFCSLVVGVVEIVDGAVDVSSGDTQDILIGAGDIAYGVNEVAELGDFIEDIAAYVVAGRVGLMALTGILNFIASAES